MGNPPDSIHAESDLGPTLAIAARYRPADLLNLKQSVAPGGI
jgi:hypothetical protein